MESISGETVRQALKKIELKPWLKECWCPARNAEWKMYWKSTSALRQRSAGVLDETSKQQVKETRVGRPAGPGAAATNTSAMALSNLFMLFAPLARSDGPPHESRIGRGRSRSWLRTMWQGPDCAGDGQPEHPPSGLVVRFEPAEARRIARPWRSHYTPKHGSWLNIGRDRGAGPAMSGSAYGQPKYPAPRGQRLARPTQPGHDTSELALHHRGCAHQTEVSISSNSRLLNY